MIYTTILNMEEKYPMHFACKNGHYKSVETLLNDGYDVNSIDSDGRTPLIWACLNGHADIVRLLLAREAAVNEQGKDGWSALMLASRYGHIISVELLIEKGARVNLQKNDGLSALMVASRNGYSNVVKVLIKKGAEVNMQNNDGSSALIIASRNGHSDIVNILVEEGAQVNKQKNDGWSALMAASRSGHGVVVEILIQKGAEVNMQNNDGWSALMTASRSGHSIVVKILIEKGAKLNIQNNDGWSALMTASQDGRYNVVKILIEKGAQLNMQKKDGRSALMLACHNNKKEVAQILLDHQADTNIQDTVGKTALTCAFDKQHTEIVKLLESYEDTSAGRCSSHKPPVKPVKKSPELSLKVLSMELKTMTNPIQLGVGLGVPQHRLEIIKKNDPQDIDQQKFNLFSFIAKNCIVLEITWERIADTLEEFVSMGNLAQEIRKKFVNSGPSVIEDELSKVVVTLDGSNKECISNGLFIFKDQSIGRGAFGTVFRGEFDGDLCAVKILCPVADEIQLQLPIASLASTDSTNRFRKECEFLESFQHANIVRHLATKKHPKTNHLVLALELMDCNLRQYFTPKPGKEPVKLSLAIQTSLCHNIASALEYIHSRGVVHRDLCGENVLLYCGGETPVAKVCDFGMSKITKNDAQSVSLQFARKGYMPPEATRSSCYYNSMFDIYSFGALMVQIVCHLPTIKDEKERSFELKLIQASHPIKEVIMDCLIENRDDRPSAIHLKKRLKALC